MDYRAWWRDFAPYLYRDNLYFCSFLDQTSAISLDKVKTDFITLPITIPPPSLGIAIKINENHTKADLKITG